MDSHYFLFLAGQRYDIKQALSDAKWLNFSQKILGAAVTVKEPLKKPGAIRSGEVYAYLSSCLPQIALLQ
ncbi:MAG: hypothetical protein RQ899_05550 [Pseudomonadales bacterium]|nr:hypothetical protein [Pseudomonadales bacterium]